MRHFVTLLSIQESAGTISLIGTFVVIAVVLFVILTSNKGEDKVTAKKKVYHYRRRYFWGLIVVLFLVTLISFKFMPYSNSNDSAKDEQVVTVVGFQWGWKLVQGVTDKSPQDLTGTNEITLPMDKNIKFVVTSTDVNHNFAIYDKDGQCVAQTQAMPGYHNQLAYNFKTAGEYKILCLEYCGIPHAFMVGSIHIK